jgi:hypothetical protein
MGKDASHTPGDVNGPKPFARVAHDLPMAPDQEDFQFQMESSAPCQGRMQAIPIWLSYGTRARSIENLCIKGSQKSP